MKPKLSDLWRFDGLVGRGVFMFWGLLLFFVKYNLDRIVAQVFYGQNWSLFDPATLRFYLWQHFDPQQDKMLYLVLLATSLPFLWAGIALTVRRLRSLGWSGWWVLVFFLPFLKLFFFAVLVVFPGRDAKPPVLSPAAPPGAFGRLIPKSLAGSALVGMLVSVVFGVGSAALGTVALGDYGWSLFVGVPFVMGFLSVLIYSCHERRTIVSCIIVALVAVVFAGAALLLVAIEGLICLLMAAPIAFALGIVGGVAGYFVQDAVWRRREEVRLYCVVLLTIPAAMGVEYTVPPTLPLLHVQSSVIIDAPPEKVWQNVVCFSELPPPTEAIFKLGVAYPIRAEIDGQGVGAVRHCNFSTGPFIEPIEVWDEPRLLKFSVTQNPEPMQEWTPYRNVHPRHLDGYLQSCGGQFRLEALPGNRTRLEGTTWYYHHLWPANYWQWWSDEIIHTIHMRVLNHIKQLSEEK